METASDKIRITIDGRSSSVSRSTTLLDAARQMGIAIPTLCFLRGMEPHGACRVCMVEIETSRGSRLVASCSFPVEEELVVHTASPKVLDSRKVILELLLAEAPGSKELAEFAAHLGVTSTPLEPSSSTEQNRCILCGLCVRVCNDLMGRGAISLFGRGSTRQVQTPFQEPTDQCQACGACALSCPTGAIDLNRIASRQPREHKTRHDQFLTARPSIDLAHPQASPRVPFIDRENCVHFKTGDCGLCSEVCGAGAIQYDQEERETVLDVGAVVLTPGFEAFDAKRRGEFGFGFAPNVLSNLQFERLLSASGPTQGHVLRPSDNEKPRRMAFIQCVGSRDTGCDNDYCSSVCCMAATKQAILAKTHEPGLEVTIFFLDLRAFGKDFDKYCDRAQKQLGVRYIRSFVSRTYEMPGTKNLRLVYADENIRQVEEEFDMVVLSLGLEPSASLTAQAERFGILLNRWGFADTRETAPLNTSRPGIFVGGTFQEPKDIPDTVMQASASAAKAMALLANARGTLVKTKKYPPEKDITDEPPRIGVFICHCGSNIASVVDVEAVTREARLLPHVAFASHNTYACANDTQGFMKEAIAEHRLNRIVVASCTPRTHEPIFRDTLREAGLNPYLLEMANIRDQCSWVHPDDPERATSKAIDLVRMIVARASQLEPLQEEKLKVNNAALVVGGGIAGMTAALALSEQGFPVHLVEQENELGGTIQQLHRTLDGSDVQALLRNTVRRVSEDPRIHLHLNTRVRKVNGHLGEFKSELTTGEEILKVEHGVVVLATGATEGKPHSFGYGKDERILTQLELSDRLGLDQLHLPEEPIVAMIQCVEQRTEERPTCSRLCCTTAVKNALLLLDRYPKARIMVLYRDMRTYGFKEAAYREARRRGVLFVRYEPTEPPLLTGAGENASLTLTVKDPTLNRMITLNPDRVVLAAPVLPRANREELAELLRVPLNAEGFFVEAHMKLRPVDFASEGLFLCGTAHAPKFISETLSQAHAVAARAASILSRKEMPVSGQIAYVDPDKCISCMTCVHLCPYLAPKVGQENKAEIQTAVCMGCGSCASECPAKAIGLRHYREPQILATIEGLLGYSSEEEPAGLTVSQTVGVAPPRFHRG